MKIAGSTNRRDAGIVANVAHLLVFREVRGDEFVSVRRRPQRDPDHAYLGAAVGIQGDKGGIGTLADEVARGVIEFHGLFYHCASRFIPAADFEVERLRSAS